MRHFNVLLIAWTKSQDSVHESHFLKRKESRSGSNRGPSAYQSSALPLGHTGSQRRSCPCGFIRGRSHDFGGQESTESILFTEFILNVGRKHRKLKHPVLEYGTSTLE